MSTKKNEIEVYKRLRKEIDKLPIGFPASESGTEIQLLKELFTPQEAEIAVNLNIIPEKTGRIYKRLKKNGINITREDLEKVLDELSDKGAILGELFHEKKKKRKYQLAPMAVGIFEFQGDKLSSEFAENFFTYFREAFRHDFYGTKTSQVRTVPINKSITPDMRVESYNDMRTYIKNYKDEMGVLNCICRKSQDLMHNPCKHSDIRETCIVLGYGARYWRGRGMGRSVSRKELLAILDRAEEAGFILQPENAANPAFICCCCTDCCHVLQGYRLHPRPADLFQSDYYAVVDESLCNGCKKCEKKCGMEAISVTRKRADVNLNRCLGCGVCVPACPNGAVKLHAKKEKNNISMNRYTLHSKIMKERYGLGGTLGILSKVVTGRKV